MSDSHACVSSELPACCYICWHHLMLLRACGPQCQPGCVPYLEVRADPGVPLPAGESAALTKLNPPACSLEVGVASPTSWL